MVAVFVRNAAALGPVSAGIGDGRQETFRPLASERPFPLSITDASRPVPVRSAPALWLSGLVSQCPDLFVLVSRVGPVDLVVAAAIPAAAAAGQVVHGPGMAGGDGDGSLHLAPDLTGPVGLQ